MALLVRTSDSTRLLERIHELVTECCIPWKWEDGRLTLHIDQRHCAAAFAIKLMDSAILFSIVSLGGERIGQRDYALLHARLIEDLVTECDSRLETLHMTAKAGGVDETGRPATVQRISA